MGKAQKLKQQRKIEQEEQKKKNRKAKMKKGITFLIILACSIVVIIIAIWLINYSKDTRQVVIETEKGDIKLELYHRVAPKTVDNFIKLAEEGFYDSITFHRVVEDFIIQGGDPLSKDDDPSNDGSGGPGYAFEDEINPVSLGLTFAQTKELEALGYRYKYDIKSIPHETGVLSMANSGPNTNGSQFFIIIGPAQLQLNGLHTAFGKVYEGMEIVREIKQGDIMQRVYLLK